jgi:outer membrane usher protein
MRLLTAGYGLTLWRGASLMVSASRSGGPAGVSAVTVLLSFPLEGSRNGMASLGRSGGLSTPALQVQQSTPLDEGLGWRLAASGQGAMRRADAGATVNTGRVSLSADLATQGGDVSWRAGASGGYAWLDGRGYLARRIHDSFGVVHAPDLPGLSLSVNNVPMARTDEAGYALLPRLLPYQANTVRFNPDDLPLDLVVDQADVTVNPAYRSGVSVRLPVRRERSALLPLVNENGQPLPAGATVQVQGQSQTYPVGLQGQAFLRDVGQRVAGVVSWPGQACRFEVILPAAVAGQLLRLASVTCHKGLVP